MFDTVRIYAHTVDITGYKPIGEKELNAMERIDMNLEKAVFQATRNVLARYDIDLSYTDWYILSEINKPYNRTFRELFRAYT